MAFINVAPAGTELLIPSTDITALVFDPHTNVVSITTSAGILIRDEVTRLIGIHNIAQKLADAGSPLHYFPSHYRDSGNEIPCYVRPSAVDHLTISPSSEEAVLRNVQMGIAGFGIHDACDYTPQQVEDMLAEIGKTQKLVSYKPEVAKEQWYYASHYYLAPEKLTAITSDGRHELTALFGKTSVKIATTHLNWTQRNNAIHDNGRNVNAIANRLLNIKKNPTQEQLKKIFELAQEKKNKFSQDLDARESAACKSVIREFARFAPHLLAIEAANLTYLQPKDIGHIFVSSEHNDFSIRLVQPSAATYAERLTLWFHTAADRDSTLAKLEQDLSPKPATSKNPPKAAF